MDGGIRTDTLAITPAILRLIAEIDEFKGAWKAIGRISPERLTALRRIATIESIGSSTRIEGAKLSDKAVEQLLAGLEAQEFAVALFIVVFLEIHPFQDGNGRLSRILTTLLLLRADYALVPYSSLESVIEQNKDAYYIGLRQTQATICTDAPDWQPWLTLFLNALQQQKARLEKKMERERLVLGDLPELSVQILNTAAYPA